MKPKTIGRLRASAVLGFYLILLFGSFILPKICLTILFITTVGGILIFLLGVLFNALTDLLTPKT